jgi:benzoylformate decarboxylase
MDRLAERTGEAGPWPSFETIDLSAMARSLGCPAERLDEHDALVSRLDELVPDLGAREEPLLLEVVVEPTTTFEP